MNKLKHIIAALLCVTVIGSLTACGQPVHTPSAGSSQTTELTQTQQNFNTYLDNLFKNSFTNSIDLHFKVKNPTQYGIELQPNIGQINHKTYEETLEYNQKTLTTLKQYSLKDLTPEQQLTYRILEDYYTAQETNFDTYYYGNMIGSITGLQANYPLLFAEYKFYTEQDIKDYFILLEQLDSVLSSSGDYLKEQSAQGLFGADFIADKAIEQIQSITSEPNNLFITSFAEKLDSFDGLDAAAKQQYIEQNNTLVKISVVPSFQKLSDTISSLKGTGYEGGMCNVKNGKKFYEVLIKTKTGSSKSVDEIFKTLKKREENLIKEVQQLTIKDPKILDKLRKIEYSNASAQEMMDILMEKSKKDYPELSHVDYQIKDIPKSLIGVFESPAAYLIPPIDSAVENTIYVNDHINDAAFFTTMAHEGYPGHLYQNNYSLSLNKHPILYLLDYPGYSEGWATYVQFHSYELDDSYKGNTNLMKIDALNYEYGLLLSSIADIGVNYYGWDLNKMNDIFAQLGLPEMPDLYEHIVSEPGNYLEYYIGYLEIEELRQDASTQLGNKFNAKEFNKVILETGPSSFKILKEEVNKYIASKK